MSLAEAVGGRAREPVPRRRAAPLAGRRIPWFDDFEGAEDFPDESPVSTVPGRATVPLDSKGLFLDAVELPRSDSLQANFPRYVQAACARMIAPQGPTWHERPIEVGHPAREEAQGDESVLLRSAELLAKVANRPAAEIVGKLRAMFAPDASARTATEVQGTVLEAFLGYVDRVDGDVAHVRLKSREHGDVLHGTYPASDLASKGIVEQGRFLCETVKVGDSTRLALTALPDVVVSEDELRAIDERIHRVIPRDDPGIEY